MSTDIIVDIEAARSIVNMFAFDPKGYGMQFYVLMLKNGKCIRVQRNMQYIGMALVDIQNNKQQTVTIPPVYDKIYSRYIKTLWEIVECLEENGWVIDGELPEAWRTHSSTHYPLPHDRKRFIELLRNVYTAPPMTKRAL